jgi:hypothetical protein
LIEKWTIEIVVSPVIESAPAVGIPTFFAIDRKSGFLGVYGEYIFGAEVALPSI